jgi:hypothetical protein
VSTTELNASWAPTFLLERMKRSERGDETHRTRGEQADAAAVPRRDVVARSR